MLVVEKDVAGADKEMLGFETLTFVPIDRRLIDADDAVATRERAWLNDYHAEVLAKIGPQLEGEDKAWLERQCAPLSAELGALGWMALGSVLTALYILGPRVAVNRGARRRLFARPPGSSSFFG